MKKQAQFHFADGQILRVKKDESAWLLTRDWKTMFYADPSVLFLHTFNKEFDCGQLEPIGRSSDIFMLPKYLYQVFEVATEV